MPSLLCAPETNNESKLLLGPEEPSPSPGTIFVSGGERENGLHSHASIVPLRTTRIQVLIEMCTFVRLSPIFNPQFL